MFGLDASGVKMTLPVLVNKPRWVALPEPVGLTPMRFPLPSRIGVAIPFPLAEKGRSTAATAKLPTSSVSVSTRNLTVSERFILSSPSSLKCNARHYVLEWRGLAKHHTRKMPRPCPVAYGILCVDRKGGLETRPIQITEF